MNFDAKHLYLSSDGRIGRKSYWIAGIAMAVVSIFVSVLLQNMLAGTALLVAAIIWQLVLSYPVYHLMAKRFQDRNKSASIALYVIIAFFILTVITLVTTPPPGQMPGAGMMIASFAILALGIWLLVELGFLRGTIGPNKYGPDPVGN